MNCSNNQLAAIYTVYNKLQQRKILKMNESLACVWPPSFHQERKQSKTVAWKDSLLTGNRGELLRSSPNIQPTALRKCEQQKIAINVEEKKMFNGFL